MLPVLISVLAVLRGVVRSRVATHLEVLALRHQLQVLQRSRPLPVRKLRRDRIIRQSPHFRQSPEVVLELARTQWCMISNLAGLAPCQPVGHACAMDALPPPLAFIIVLVFAGWVNR